MLTFYIFIKFNCFPKKFGKISQQKEKLITFYRVAFLYGCIIYLGNRVVK